MIHLRPCHPEDADALFPLVYRNPVTDTLLWDGPESLQEYREGLAERYALTRAGNSHVFTIVRNEDGQPIGGCTVRPEPQANFRGDTGIWVGAPYHNQGYGTLAVRNSLVYGFAKLGMQKLEATVFVGNHASRNIFEKNGLRLEGTIRYAVQKRGELVDEWLLGITRPEWEAQRAAQTGERGSARDLNPILHVCQAEEWLGCLKQGEYRHTTLEQEGFIHCSRPEQLPGVLERYFAGANGLVCLWLDPLRLRPELRWEDSDADVFPHVYGPINLDAVLFVDELPG